MFGLSCGIAGATEMLVTAPALGPTMGHAAPISLGAGWFRLTEQTTPTAWTSPDPMLFVQQRPHGLLGEHAADRVDPERFAVRRLCTRRSPQSAAVDLCRAENAQVSHER